MMLQMVGLLIIYLFMYLVPFIIPYALIDYPSIYVHVTCIIYALGASGVA